MGTLPYQDSIVHFFALTHWQVSQAMWSCLMVIASMRVSEPQLQTDIMNNRRKVSARSFFLPNISQHLGIWSHLQYEVAQFSSSNFHKIPHCSRKLAVFQQTVQLHIYRPNHAMFSQHVAANQHSKLFADAKIGSFWSVCSNEWCLPVTWNTPRTLQTDIINNRRKVSARSFFLSNISQHLGIWSHLQYEVAQFSSSNFHKIPHCSRKLAVFQQVWNFISR